MPRLLLLGLCLVLGCGGSGDGAAADAGPVSDAAPGADAAPRDRYAPFDSDGRRFRDAQNRTAILRGVNARVRGVFDVTFDDPECPANEPIPELTASDCARMAELGFNVLRLPVHWSGIEPERDVIDEDYLVQVDAAIECAGNAGLVVLIDLHQDGYSKFTGEDGAPLWAIPVLDEQLCGPLMDNDLANRRTSNQVLQSFLAFFAPGDATGLQAEYIDMLELLATRYADNDAVMGIELYNEPFADPIDLRPFYEAAAKRIRAAAPDKLVFFEPNVIRNTDDQQPPVDPPFPVAGAVYAPHIYTYAIETDAAQHSDLPGITIADIRPSHVAARDEADLWQTPLFITEFGIGPELPNYEGWIRLQYEAQEEQLSSSTFWLWKEQSQGYWGLHDIDGDGAWSERPAMVEAVSRPFAHAIAGTASVMRWDGSTLRLVYDDAVAAPNVVYVPERFAVASVTCDGEAVTTGEPDPLLQVSCGGPGEHTVVVALTAR